MAARQRENGTRRGQPVRAVSNRMCETAVPVGTALPDHPAGAVALALSWPRMAPPGKSLVWMLT